jgi:hypothetical protein
MNIPVLIDGRNFILIRPVEGGWIPVRQDWSMGDENL